ncbi:MAG: hypothetical protein IT379_40065 [Deltaproteobacteria bacterium]|nr:hypothetical protein [Deltaproteobacteria bacterium]
MDGRALGRRATTASRRFVDAALLLLVVLCGCETETERTSIEVVVSEASSGLPMRLDRIALIVSRADGVGDPVSYEGAASYDGTRLRPYSVSVSPRGGSDPGRVLYRFEATGSVAGDAYVVARAKLVFLRGARLTLPLRLAADCIEVTCDANETCQEGTCRSADVDPCSLPGAEHAPSCDGSTQMDAAIDASRDAGVDRPRDASADARGQEASTERPDAGDAAIPVPPPPPSPPPPPPPPPPECVEDVECDDRNACTTERCASGRCRHDDVSCDDGVPCTVDLCIPASGECDHAVTGGSCLIDGVCWGEGDASPTNECRVCAPTTSTTTWTPREDGTTCNGTRFCCRGACLGCGPMNCEGCGERCVGVDIFCNVDTCACEPI